MADLTPEGQRIVEETARRYSMSTDAVRAILEALVASGGGMAQFNHPDLGGMGQWSSGGMIMIGDTFNSGLKSRIGALCAELSDLIGHTDIISGRPQSSQWQSQGSSGSIPLPDSSFFVRGHDRGAGNWWPSDLGIPGSTGTQNNLRYACFPQRRRLALDVDGRVSVYDTGNHSITGFSQQQADDQSLTFTSQHGVVRLDSLPLISDFGPAAGDRNEPVRAPIPQPSGQSIVETSKAGADIFSNIERLAGLRDKGIISAEEFLAKKTELLRRL
jgi:Short C-terminal domain